MSDDLAQRLLELGVAEATRRGRRVTLAVVDDGGHLIALRRMDGASLMSLATASDKAFTAVAAESDTATFYELLSGTPALLAGVPSRGRIAAFGGGVPIVRGGEVCGALGVSGGSPDEDHEMARQAVDAIND